MGYLLILISMYLALLAVWIAVTGMERPPPADRQEPKR